MELFGSISAIATTDIWRTSEELDWKRTASRRANTLSPDLACELICSKIKTSLGSLGASPLPSNRTDGGYGRQLFGPSRTECLEAKRIAVRRLMKPYLCSPSRTSIGAISTRLKHLLENRRWSDSPKTLKPKPVAIGPTVAARQMAR